MEPISTQLAIEIADDISTTDKETALDPATAFAIASVLLDLAVKCAPYIKNLANIKNPGLVAKFRLKRSYIRPAIKKWFHRDSNLSIRLTRIEQGIFNSLLKRAKTATPEEIERLIAEAQNKEE